MNTGCVLRLWYIAIRNRNWCLYCEVVLDVSIHWCCLCSKQALLCCLAAPQCIYHHIMRSADFVATVTQRMNM